jgi:hypothetical protein
MHKWPVIGNGLAWEARWPEARESVPMRLGVGWVWELQLFALFGRLQPQKRLQLSLIPLNGVRPVTPKVAGSSPVAPAIFQ